MKHDYCVACANKENLYQHHLVPKSAGGSNDDNNLITLCGECHAKIHGNRSKWNTSELTSDGLQQKRTNNELVGSVPYGFDAVPTGKKSDKTGREVKKLVPNDYEQAVIARIKALRNANQNKLLSFQKIAYALKSEGFKTRNGGTEWHATSIERILKTK